MMKKYIVVLIILTLTSCTEIVTNDNLPIGDSQNEGITSEEEITKESVDSMDLDENEGIYSVQLTSLTSTEEKVASMYNYLSDEWNLKEYINLVWYPTGEDNDNDLREEYEKLYTKYLGDSIIFNESNLQLPTYLDGINIYEDANDYIYKYSINKELVSPIVEVFGEMEEGDDDVPVRFIFDGSGAIYFEYNDFFFQIERNHHSN